MARPIIDITGQRFGKLVVTAHSHTEDAKAYWRCQCDCGCKTSVRGTHLRQGQIKSCGCLSFVHGDCCGSQRTPEYITWRNMLQRCGNPRAHNYKYYGGRGIRVCDRWVNSYTDFLLDVGRKPTDEHTLDRIDVNGNYEPGNVRWATWSEQAANKRDNWLRRREAA